MKRKILQIFIMASFLLFPMATPVAAHHCFGHEGEAAITDNVSECLDAGACLNTTATKCPSQKLAGPKLEGILHLVLNVFSAIVGVVAVIMIIVSGLKYITSSGDSASVNSAKNTLLYAVVGLVVVVFSQIIVQFVLSKTKPLPACPPGKTKLDNGKACRTP